MALKIEKSSGSFLYRYFSLTWLIVHTIWFVWSGLVQSKLIVQCNANWWNILAYYAMKNVMLLDMEKGIPHKANAVKFVWAQETSWICKDSKQQWAGTHEFNRGHRILDGQTGFQKSCKTPFFSRYSNFLSLSDWNWSKKYSIFSF